MPLGPPYSSSASECANLYVQTLRIDCLGFHSELFASVVLEVKHGGGYFFETDLVVLVDGQFFPCGGVVSDDNLFDELVLELAGDEAVVVLLVDVDHQLTAVAKWGQKYRFVERPVMSLNGSLRLTR